MKKLKYIDMFAGIGGFHRAADNFNNRNNKYKLECVMAIEIDKNASDNYKLNFPNTKIVSDVRQIKNNEIPEHDILFAGFPCQSFSQGGKREGFNDKIRGTLFFEIVRFLEEKKPSYILLENVKGLVSHDNYNTLKTIKDRLIEAGYVLTEDNVIISPDEIGIPQNRERIYIMGIRKDIIKRKSVKMPSLKSVDFKLKYTEKSIEKYYIPQKLNAVINAWQEFINNVNLIEGRTIPVIWLDEMNDQTPDDFENLKKWKQKYIRDMKDFYELNKEFIDEWQKKNMTNKWTKRDRKLEWQAGKNVLDVDKTMLQLRQSGLRFSSLHRFPALVAMVQIPIFVKERRFMTVEEVAQLQSFECHVFDERDQVAYKQLGNSVSVEVVSQLIEELILNN